MVTDTNHLHTVNNINTELNFKYLEVSLISRRLWSYMNKDMFDF